MVISLAGGSPALPPDPQPIAAAGPAEGRPPYADRGVETLNGVCGRFSTAVDFLTLTLPSDQAGLLTAETAHAEDGYPKQRFGRSELRTCLGGSCWRRWHPSQASKGWGLAYESWEFVGSVASLYAGLLVGKGRPSRVDVAFDFVVDRRLFVRAFMARLDGLLRHGVVPEWSERGDDSTCYLGARSSEWRICVYRKDLQQGPLWDQAFPCVLRIEARMKGDLARDFWSAWSKSPAEGFAMVSGRVASWLGVSVFDHSSEWVEVVKPEEFDHAERLLSFVQQHGGTLTEFVRAGVPVVELAAAAASKRSRVTAWRSERRLREMARLDVPGIVELVRRALIDSRAVALEVPHG